MLYDVTPNNVRFHVEHVDAKKPALGGLGGGEVGVSLGRTL